MSYRPICDIWLLGRPKVKYYGAYPGGFLSRARDLLGVGPNDYLLHACSGKVNDYPFRGHGSQDFTLDIDPATTPDFCQDVRKPWPVPPAEDGPNGWPSKPPPFWDAVLSDPPYSQEDALHYSHVAQNAYPSPKEILARAWEVLRPGGKVGIVHYVIPSPPKDAIFVACVGVVMGFGNKGRFYSVFQKPEPTELPSD